MIISPLRRPQTTPTIRPMIMLSQIGRPAIEAITAIVPDRAMTDPMERSMPAVMIVKVSPMPMRVIVLVCRASVRTFRTVKKFLAVIEKKVKHDNRAQADKLVKGASGSLLSPGLFGNFFLNLVCHDRIHGSSLAWVSF